MSVITTRSTRRPRHALSEAAQEPAGPLAGRRFSAAVAGCAGLAALAAAPTIAREPLGRDEFETLAVASQPIGDFFTTLSQRQNGMLFDIALWPVVHLGGDAEAWLRLPALLAFVAAIPLAAAVGRRIGGAAIGLGAAFLLAIHPFAVRYAQEGRPYTFALFFVLLATLLLLRALEAPSLRAFGGYALAAAAVFYSHDIAVVALVSHVVLVAASPNRALRRRFLAVAVAIGGLAVPLFLFLPKNLTGVLWWAPPPLPGPAARTLEAMAGSWAGIPICVAVLTAGLIGFRRLGRAGRLRPFGPSQLSFLAVWLAAPLVITVLVSLYQPLLVPRYLLPSLPALCVLLAASVLLVAASSRFPRRRVAVAGFAVLLATFGAVTGWNNVDLEKADWRAAAAFLEQNTDPEDRIAFVGEAVQNANAILYYSDGLVPGKEPPLTSYGTDYTPRRFLIIRLIADAATLRSDAAGAGVVWVVDWGAARYPATRAGLALALEHCAVESYAVARDIPIYRVTGCR